MHDKKPMAPTSAPAKSLAKRPASGSSAKINDQASASSSAPALPLPAPKSAAGSKNKSTSAKTSQGNASAPALRATAASFVPHPPLQLAPADRQPPLQLASVDPNTSRLPPSQQAALNNAALQVGDACLIGDPGALIPPSSEAKPPTGFRGRNQNAPLVADLIGADLLHLPLSTDHLHSMWQIWLSRNKLTFSHHFRVLFQIKFMLQNSVNRDPRWKQVPLVEILILYMERMAQIRPWQQATQFREWCNLVGAFASLPLYSPEVGNAVRLCQSPRWKHAMDHMQKISQESQPHHQLAASVDDICLGVANSTDLQSRVGLILQFYTAARVGDVAQLHVPDLQLDPVTRHVKVTIRRGKVIARRGPYCVNTYLSSDHYQELEAYLDKRVRELQLFPQAPTLFSYSVTQLASIMRTDLRTASPNSEKPLTTRAIRRGALQTMAKNGVPVETLLTFSGHTNVNTLKRYLNFGRILSVEEAGARVAASFLAPPPPVEPPMLDH
jgi:hypothetical protein